MAQKMQVTRKILEQYNLLQKEKIITSMGCSLGFINRKDAFHWIFSLYAPQNTAYAGGLFYFTIDFPADFPQTKPEVKLLNKIYHLNVAGDGHVCISTLNDWKPNTPMMKVISDIFGLFETQNPDSSYYGEASNFYRNNKEEFNKRAKEMTKQYANAQIKRDDLLRGCGRYKNLGY